MTFVKRIFGFGTIVNHFSNDVDTPVKEIKSIKNARKVLEMIDKQIDMNRDKYNIRGRDMYGGEPHHGEMEFNDYDPM